MLQVTTSAFNSVGPGQTSTGLVEFTSPDAASFTAAITTDPNSVFRVVSISATRPTVEYVQSGDPSEGVRRPPKPVKVIVDVPAGSSNGIIPLSVRRGDLLTIEIQMVCPANPDDSYSATLTITGSNAADTTPVPLTAPTGQIEVQVINNSATASPGSTAIWSILITSVAGPTTSVSFAAELYDPIAATVSIATVTVSLPRRGQQTLTLTAEIGELTPPGTYSFFVAETAFNDTFSPFSLSLTVNSAPVLVTSTQPSAFAMAVGSQVQFTVDVQLQGVGTTFNLTVEQPLPGLSCTFLDAQNNPIPQWSVPLTTKEQIQFQVLVTMTRESVPVEALNFFWSAYNGAGQGTLNFAITVTPQSRDFSAVVHTPSGTALGGSVQLTVRSDGTYTFSGQMHDSGLDPYDFRIRVLLTAPTYVVAMQKSGHTDGGLSNVGGSINRDFTWSETDANPTLQMFWTEIERSTITVNFSYQDVGLLHAIEDLARDFVSFLAAYSVVGGAVAAVIAIGSELTSLAGAGAGPGGLVGVVVAAGVCMVWGPLALIPAAVAGVAAGAVTNALIQSRPITAAEANFADQVYNGTLPPASQIVLTNLSGLNGRAFTVPNAAGTILINIGNGFPNPTGYTFGAYTTPGQVFIHELVHAWQITHRTFTPGLICEAIVNETEYIFGEDVYAYGAAGPPYSHFDLEAQGAIVDQWWGGTRFQGQNKADPNDPYFIYIANNIRLGQT